MYKAGLSARLFGDSFDVKKIIEGDGTKTTEKNKWHMILEKGEGSELPMAEGFFFMSPNESDNQITLSAGDKVIPIDTDGGSLICRTSANIDVTMETTETPTDCKPGSSITTGIVKFSGSIEGLYDFNKVTNEFDPVTEKFINYFFDTVVDDAKGKYTLKPRNSSDIYLMVNYDENTAEGQWENWIVSPIILSSLGTSFGLNDALNKNISFAQGDGVPLHYKRLRAA